MTDEVFSGDNDFWATYQKGRPQVPDSFFDRIFSYHSEHGGRFGSAHDAGGGGGIHTARLAKRFDRLLLTDVSAANIETAKTHLHGQYDFRVARLEDTIDLPAGSMDLVFASTMLHFTDTERAVAAVAHQLKPGGTFAASLQGFLALDDVALNEKFLALMSAGVVQMRRTIGEDLDPVIVTQATGYDSVALPESYFQPDSIRLRLNENPNAALEDRVWYKVVIPKHLSHEFDTVSRISAKERVVFEDDDDWLFRGDVTAVRRFFETIPFDMKAEDTKGLWDDLANAIGDKNVEGKWVVHLILATRK